MDRTKFSPSKVIRCPYCADGADFRPMARQVGGDAYMCGSCGHLSMPGSAAYHCVCQNCSKLEQKRRRWRGTSLPVSIEEGRVKDDIPVTVRNASKLPRRMGAPYR
jgi:hypothetical protein